jgi:hypothetical protein
MFREEKLSMSQCDIYSKCDEESLRESITRGHNLSFNFCIVVRDYYLGWFLMVQST